MPTDPIEPTPPTPAPDLTTDLAAARQLAAELRAERDVQRALFDAGVIDLDAGLALIKPRLAPDTDLAAVIKDLRTTKPALFRAASPPPAARTPSATLSPAPPHDPRTEMSRAADTARATGDPRSLMTYLRLRRAAD